MILINKQHTLSAHSVHAFGDDQLIVTIEDDLDSAVRLFGAVERIDVESLRGEESFVAKNGQATLMSLNRRPDKNRLTVALSGIVKEAQDGGSHDA